MGDKEERDFLANGSTGHLASFMSDSKALLNGFEQESLIAFADWMNESKANGSTGHLASLMSDSKALLTGLEQESVIALADWMNESKVMSMD